MADNTNYIVYNPGRDPLVNFNFMLRVELAIDVPCKSVRAFQRELEFDQIQEGGLNDYVHLRRKPITKPFTLEIERYVGTDYFDPLPLGAELVLPVLLFVSRSPAQFIPGVTARTYVFHGCTVMKKTYGDLVADQPGILVETTTIAYREMLCVDVPWSKAGDNILAPDPAQAHSAKTLSTEPKDLKTQGQRLYDTAVSSTSQADSQYTDADVTALITELRNLKTELETGIASGGLLETAETEAREVLNGAHQTPNMPLFDIVNDRKANVHEKKKLLREAENALLAQQTAQQAEERARKRQTETLENGALDLREKKESATTDPALDSAADKPKTPLEEAREKADAARMQLSDAQDALNTAQSEATAAQTALSVAEANTKKAREGINSLENMINNLELRSDSVKTAREKYAESLASCKKANDTLQGYNAENTGDHNKIRTTYQEVKKYHDDTQIQTKKVGEAESYRENGVELKNQIEVWWTPLQTKTTD